LSVPELTRSEVAYLQTMHRLNESRRATSVSTLAKQFGVKLPTAIGILEKLEEKGFVTRKPWKVPKLSTRGVTLAESIMHRHRIVELYFSRILGLSHEKSCKEASKVDYLLDKTVIQKMCKALNRPSHCNHGNPIQHPNH